jgi:hypothetical protein
MLLIFDSLALRVRRNFLTCPISSTESPLKYRTAQTLHGVQALTSPGLGYFPKQFVLKYVGNLLFIFFHKISDHIPQPHTF